jgi:hypothetical protein
MYVTAGGVPRAQVGNPPPRKRGRGTTRSVVEGAFDSKLRKSSMIDLRCSRPSPALRAVPPPRYRGAGCGEHREHSTLPRVRDTGAQASNSRERAVAAAIASFISRMRPFGPISTASAAAVVPPGEVTF